MTSRNAVHRVPTNIVTGFLGSGKTTAILKLLEKKPTNERWAVLVNEFGEQGIDGSFIEGSHGEASGVFVKEIPGGCMCCTAGLSMQIGLTQLLSRSKPDRLIIEPTGLGHPREVLETLLSQNFSDVIAIQSVITLIDPHHLLDNRYLQNQIFREQILLANVIFLNKQDLFSEDEMPSIEALIHREFDLNVPVINTSFGEIELDLLNIPKHLDASDPQHNLKNLTGLNSTEGSSNTKINEHMFKSKSWTFSCTQTFDYHQLFILLSGLSVERMKAVFITDQGVFGYNMTQGSLAFFELDDAAESCIELIGQNLNHRFNIDLLQTVIND